MIPPKMTPEEFLSEYEELIRLALATYADHMALSATQARGNSTIDGERESSAPDTIDITPSPQGFATIARALDEAAMRAQQAAKDLSEIRNPEAEQYAEQAREAVSKLAWFTLTAEINAKSVDRILEPLTHMLSELPGLLRQLGDWHQENMNRASSTTAALTTALRMYEASRYADGVHSNVSQVRADREHINWPSDISRGRRDRLAPPSSFGPSDDDAGGVGNDDLSR